MPPGIRYHLRLREARERLGLTAQEVAERAGVSVEHLSRLETGKHAAFATTARKLADALGLTLDQLRGLTPFPWERETRE